MGAPRYSLVMLRLFAAMAAACCLLGPLVAPARAQSEWNDARTMALVHRATELRERQLADTALHDWRALARGYLTFLAQLGEGFTEPPKVIKADELALEVYWRAPGLSKQRIIGRRDTLLLPTDIAYHQDHLGIIQNNFPEVIRIGDGDEVRDVPHPLSPQGLEVYEFAIGDSIEMRLPDRTIAVAIVRVRPPTIHSRVWWAHFHWRESAQLVRMAFNSRAPRSSIGSSTISRSCSTCCRRSFGCPPPEIEIRRSERGGLSPSRHHPRRGRSAARGEHWADLACSADPRLCRPRAGYSTLTHGAERFSIRCHPMCAPADPGAIIQEEARRLVRAQALRRSRRATVAARVISTSPWRRAEGLRSAPGSREASAAAARGGADRYGIGDEQIKGRAEMSWMRASGVGVRLFGERSIVTPATSWTSAGQLDRGAGIRSDATERRLRAVVIAAELGRTAPCRGLTARMSVTGPSHCATPSRGRYEPVIEALAHTRASRRTIG